MIDPDVEATFDQYGRFFLTAKIIEANRSKKGLTILDVGGYAGKTADFLPQDSVTILDIIDDSQENYVRGNGLNMPFDDKYFDVVVTTDTLEHISADKRQLFLEECYRVSKEFLIVVAPFESGNTSRTEKEVNNVYRALAGKPYPWLKEHVETGLPKTEVVTAWAKKHGLNYFSIANNNLEEWRSLISHYFVLENLPSRKGSELLRKRFLNFNQTRNRYPAEAPAYRQIFAISKETLKQPELSNVPTSEDFKSLVPIVQTMKYFLQENNGSITNNEYLKAALKVGAYIPIERNQLDLMKQEITKIRAELNQVKASKSWRALSWLRSSRTYCLFVSRFWKLARTLKHISGYGVYLYPPALLWRIKTGIPAYGRSRLRNIRFATNKKPQVSIIIPIFGKATFTLNCLMSLTKLETKYSFEVIVIDDCSKDASSEIFSTIPGMIFHSNQKNQGFVISCNTGAKLAKGKYLVFLNNDTVVDSQWLDPLINRLEASPDVGLVGSKLVYPNGTLQEAGGIIFSDASGWNYGRGGNRDDYEYNYVREVDYCSGASIAVPRKLFDEVGCFDTRYVPAYYEDTDLAFSIRQAGYKVIYEPASQLFHHEGATAGQDLTRGMKKYQLINQSKFVEKWSDVLEQQHYLSPKSLLQARDRSRERLALVIDHYVPEPDKDSGSVRMNHLIGVLQDMGYKITFWPQNLFNSRPYTKHLQGRGVEVVYGSVDFLKFSQERGNNYDLVLLSRPSVAPSYIDVVRSLYGRAKIIYDTVDLAFLRIRRQARIEHDDRLGEIADGWEKVELGLIQRTDASLVVSPVEQKLLNKLSPDSKVSVVSNIHIQKPGPYLSFEKRRDIVFIGGFSHQPNVDATLWFCKEILPLVTKELPNILVKIVGSSPPTKVLALATDNVKVMGYIENVDDIFRRSRVFIAPLRYGAGVKGKIGQAMEYGLPVVSTSIGIEGMHLVDNESCLVADVPKAFAKAVIKLYTNKKTWEKLSVNSQEVLDKYFSPDVAKSALLKLLEELSRGS
ncbi:MAG TPA: glycosyltransferase [Candidatus Dormibacteraeota bacterium]|nr:glycosyltransferase [Candidatus Dormibacteraeota bacterium]